MSKAKINTLLTTFAITTGQMIAFRVFKQLCFSNLQMTEHSMIIDTQVAMKNSSFAIALKNPSGIPKTVDTALATRLSRMGYSNWGRYL